VNSIEAYHLVCDFCFAVSLGTDKSQSVYLINSLSEINKLEPINNDYSLLFRPKSNLPFPLDKDELVKAYKIFYAYMIFFHVISQEQYEKIYMCYKSIDLFVEDDMYDEIVNCTKIASTKNLYLKWRNKNAIPLATEKMEKYLIDGANKFMYPYKIDEIDTYFSLVQDEYLHFHTDCQTIINEKGTITNDEYFDILENCVKKIYSLAKTVPNEEDILCFNNPKLLYSWLQDEQFKHVLQKYQEIILLFQKNN